MSDIKSELIEKAMAPEMLAWAIGCGCCTKPAPEEYDRYDEPRGAWLADLMLSAVADDLRAEGAAQALRDAVNDDGFTVHDSVSYHFHAVATEDLLARADRIEARDA